MSTLKYLQDNYYYEESEADITNLTASMNTITLEDYVSRKTTYTAKDVEYFDGKSVTQVVYHSKYEERVTFTHVEHDNVIEDYGVYESDDDDVVRYIENNESSGLNYAHEIEINIIVDYDYDDEIDTYYDHGETYSKGGDVEYYDDDDNGDGGHYYHDNEDNYGDENQGEDIYEVGYYYDDDDNDY
jgi:hypothetical protein